MGTVFLNFDSLGLTSTEMQALILFNVSNRTRTDVFIRGCLVFVDLSSMGKRTPACLPQWSDDVLLRSEIQVPEEYSQELVN